METTEGGSWGPFSKSTPFYNSPGGDENDDHHPLHTTFVLLNLKVVILSVGSNPVMCVVT